MKRQAWLALNSIIVLACLLTMWQVAVLVLHVPKYMLPGPLLVWHSVIDRFGSLAASFLLTAEEAVLGLSASVIVGVVISLAFAQWRLLRKLLFPYTILLQTVPIIAITPLIVMWFGPGTGSVALIAFIICLAPIIANTTQGLVTVEENLVNLFLMHNASAMQVLLRLRLPHALPNLFVGIRISAGIAVIGAITGELFAGSSRVGGGGLGYAILYAANQLETDYLFALVFAATVLGFLFFFIGMFLEWYFLHNWHESNRSDIPE